VEHSANLLEQEFITRNEFEKDDISYMRQLSSVTLAWNDLELLIKFTLKETKIQLAQNRTNAELGLSNIIATNEASRVREESALGSAKSESALHEYILNRLTDQIGKGIITSPTPGVVVYARGRGGRMGRNSMEEGNEVRRRQEIINLPDVSQMGVDFSVHEAQIEKVAATQRAIVKVDAFPERIFTGTVVRVGALPDSTARYNNDDLKVYRARVDLDGDNSDGALKPGMNAVVEILVQSLEDVLLVPLTAIQIDRGIPYVWKGTSVGPVAQWVKLGSSNLDVAEVLDGLDDGEMVYLGIPEGSVPPTFGQEDSASFTR
jgi:multidrug efflux pump subunit AcrA (membrane-fusion protein)